MAPRVGGRSEPPAGVRAAAARGRDLRAGLERASIVVLQRLADRGDLAGMGLLRRHRPNLRLRPGATVVVTRREDVLAVLADSDTYEPSYRPRLPGPFLLGLAGPEYESQSHAMRSAIRPDDIADLADNAAQTARECVARVSAQREIDLGADLVHPVLDQVVGSYLGAPGPDGVTQWDWSRDIFEDIFLNSFELSTLREQAQVASAQMAAHLDSLIAARRGRPDVDDVLGRLLAQQTTEPGTALDDHEIRSCLMGLAIGWLWHGARAALIVMDELLNQPEALALAHRAAQDDDLDAVQRVLWETLRFRPVQFGLLRTCRRDAVLAPGTSRSLRVPAGATVILGTHSAMWDETSVPSPEVFDTTRSDEQYLIFGGGMHRCVGEAIMRAQLPAMLAPVLALDGLRRADGAAGRLRWDGPRPDGLCVNFDT